MTLSDFCQWCDAGRFTAPDDDRCRCCIEDGIGPDPLACLSVERAPPTRQQYEETMAEWAMDEERAIR